MVFRFHSRNTRAVGHLCSNRLGHLLPPFSHIKNGAAPEPAPARSPSRGKGPSSFSASETNGQYSPSFLASSRNVGDHIFQIVGVLEFEGVDEEKVLEAWIGDGSLSRQHAGGCFVLERY